MSAFEDYLHKWYEALEDRELSALLSEAGAADDAAVFCVDVTRGFCEAGPLASERVGTIVGPIRELMVLAREAGITRFYLPQDCHPADSPEFREFPPHCIEGSEEAQLMPELAALPFAQSFRILPKRSIASHLYTGLDECLRADGDPALCIVVGDCTDLCLYQLAMHLKLRANAVGPICRVIVPEVCVQTYDLPVEVAERIGAKPHDGDFLHRVFLYHMWLNGIEICRRLVPGRVGS